MATIIERPRVKPSPAHEPTTQQIERSANHLLAWVQDLGVPFRFEPSLRLSPRGIAKNRFLVSIDRTDCSFDVAERLQQFASRFRLPEIVRAALQRESIHAGHFHWGFEQHGPQLLYKFYLERAANRATLTDQDPTPMLFLAFKWLVSDPNQHVVTHYRWHPCNSLDQIRARVASNYATSNPKSPSHQATDAILDEISDQPERLPLFLEVIEPATSRRSFDINVYDSQLCVADATSAISPLLEAYRIDRNAWQQQLQRLGDLPLGHLAAGLQRNGDDFLTLYYGAQECRHDEAFAAS